MLSAIGSPAEKQPRARKLNGAGRLTGITYPGSATNSFVYNGMDQRVGKTDSTGTFSMTLADDAIDSKVLSDGSAVYRHGVGMFGESRGTTKSYYHADDHGNTSALIDSSANVTATLDHDAFGFGGYGTGSVATPFGFAGQYGYQSDHDSSLMLLGHRYYDPSTGRFLSRDPVHDGDNWYTYCNNDPVNKVDPTGLYIPPPNMGGRTQLLVFLAMLGVALYYWWKGNNDQNNQPPTTPDPEPQPAPAPGPPTTVAPLPDLNPPPAPKPGDPPRPQNPWGPGGTPPRTPLPAGGPDPTPSGDENSGINHPALKILLVVAIIGFIIVTDGVGAPAAAAL